MRPRPPYELSFESKPISNCKGKGLISIHNFDTNSMDHADKQSILSKFQEEKVEANAPLSLYSVLFLIGIFTPALTLEKCSYSRAEIPYLVAVEIRQQVTTIYYYQNASKYQLL